MQLAALANLILALAKAIPASVELWDKLAEGWQAHRAEQIRTTAHAQIDADRARLTSGPWVCPGTCPHRLLHAAPAPEPSPGPAPAPSV